MQIAFRRLDACEVADHYRRPRRCDLSDDALPDRDLGLICVQTFEPDRRGHGQPLAILCEQQHAGDVAAKYGPYAPQQFGQQIAEPHSCQCGVRHVLDGLARRSACSASARCSRRERLGGTRLAFGQDVGKGPLLFGWTTWTACSRCSGSHSVPTFAAII